VQGNALFPSTRGFRVSMNDVYIVVVKASERVGLLDSDSERMDDHFGMSLRSGMQCRSTGCGGVPPAHEEF